MAPPLQILAGTSNPQLVAAICQALEVPPAAASVTRFADGEIGVGLPSGRQR